jgi:trigger factor
MVETEFKADAQEFEAQLQATFLKKRNSILVPGFRKGKAPRKMIETQYGESVFFEDAVNGMYQKIIKNVIDELKLEVVEVSDLEVISVNKLDGVSFKAKFTTAPEVNITGYLGLKINAPSNTVTEDDVNAKLKELQIKSARIVPVSNRSVKQGDIIIFDFKGFCDGEPFDGGSADNFSLEIGSGRFIPGFEEQLVGKDIGKDFDVNVTFPEDYNAKELAGKAAVFKCRINEIKETQLSDLDDEFVKDVSEFDTIDELKEDLRKKATEEKEAAQKTVIDNKIAEQLISKLEGEIPEVMFERKIDELVNDWEYNNAKHGIKLDEYLKHANMTIEQFREFFNETAKSRVKLQLALKKVAEREKLYVSDDELEEEFAKLSEMHKMSTEQVKRAVSAEIFKKDMLNDKAFEIIRENSKITISEENE